MFEEIELKNCSEKFYLNCKNFQVKCFECKGNLTSKYLHYTPINKDINNHPANIVQKSKAISYSRKGKSKELKLIKFLPLFNSTRGSGCVNGDGDAYITISNFGKLQTEIKCRFTTTTNFLPTLKEYEEAKTQKIKIILIHLAKLNRTYFYLDFKIFVAIWKTFLSAYTILSFYKRKHLYIDDRIHEYIFDRLISKKPYTHIFKIISELDFKNSKFGITYYDELTLFIIKNKVGTFVAMNEFTFNELISLYEYTIKNINNDK